MPRITWEAIGTALLRMADKDLDSLIRETTGGNKELTLCFYHITSYESYTEAKNVYMRSLESK